MAFSRNQEVFGEGEPAEYLYKVKSGYIRTYHTRHDGRRQIAAFYLPGDVFGLEARDVHSVSADAICVRIGNLRLKPRVFWLETVG